MDRAIALAERGWGGVHTNPLVGCVLVQGDEVVGEGWHAEFGGAHAEQVALEAAGEQARGATAFVSLEPCGHEGKTPPCADALAAAGVVRVVYAVADPGAGAGGHARLRTLGVTTEGPTRSEREGRALNPGFFRRARGELPYVVLKLAFSLDGRAASAPGESTRITGIEADGEVQRLRAGFEAIMVGVGTVLIDDPRLTARPASLTVHTQPRRLVVDSRLRTPTEARLFDSTVGGGPVHVFADAEADRSRAAPLISAGATVHWTDRQGPGLDWTGVLEGARALGIGSIFCEGGPTVATSLLESGHVDQLVIFMSPSVLGAEGLPGFTRALDLVHWKPVAAPAKFGRDVCLVLEPRTQ